MKYTILAGNIKLYLDLFENNENEHIQEFVPKSAKDVEMILAELSGLVGTEDSIP